ncbi:MAG: 4Fe-4S binding protein [Candidatus Saelkia tenebricola]|nr:4Fe-4S binding protein [Candidatus Saelkia tenebricola]
MKVKLVIKRDFCKSCGFCIHFCPKNVLKLDNNLNKLGVLPVCVDDESKCIGCGQCALMCPEACIEIYKEE